ncbi:MAG TPA: HYR domain-containing protein, partial [Vicinamibacterales bacterium]|nr:HYR domain-containing protein [Vicinamibacterales bacterium]
KDSLNNVGGSTSSVTVGPRIADAPTIVNAAAIGGARLKALQNADGGWPFQVGSNACGANAASCTNTIGTTGLGLLAAYARTNDPTLLTAAFKAGDLLVARATAALQQPVPPSPVSRDIEFLVGLSGLIASTDAAKSTTYAQAAQSWFQATVAKFPNAADQIDSYITKRNAQGLRTLAAWDSASYIRAAKAVGLTDRALAAAGRIRDREADWKDTNPAHRFDRCGNPSGCGPAGNLFAFDYTILGEGSLLWAIHDLPGFDTQIAEYRDFLAAQQDPEGSWDAGDTQITSFVMMGLAAVGGPAANNAIVSAATYFLKHQFVPGGWPAEGSSTDPASEFAEVDGEVVRAIATLFSTPSGANIAVVPSQLSTVTFSNVTSPGMTTVVAVDQATIPTITGGFEIVNALSYQVTTTAQISGDITVCFSVPAINDPVVFAALRILHGEHGVLVDRTIDPPDPLAPNFPLRRVCARTSSLSPFVIARALPDAVAPVVTVPASVTIAAAGPLGAPYTYSASALDDVDGVLTPSCSPVSGATFPLGDTTVACSATDAHGNRGSASFVVTVRDSSPPAITVPANATVPAAAQSGAAYSYTVSAVDLVDGAVAVACAPASGSTFPMGTTTVQCSAADSTGNAASASFTVTVRDLTPPVVVVPGDLTIDSAAATRVFYLALAVDAIDGVVRVTCTPPSLSQFAVGSTKVTCSASDSAGNVGTASFVVKVNAPPVAYDNRYKVNADGTLAGVLKADDANDDALTFAIVANGSKGTFVVDARTGAFTYTPRKNRGGGSDELTFRVSDGRLWSNTATVRINIDDSGGGK